MPRPARNLLAREMRYGMWIISQPFRPKKYWFGTDTKPYREFKKSWYGDAVERQAHDPVKVHEHKAESWWWFEKQVYRESEGLTADDVKALVFQMQRSKESVLDRAHAEMRGEESASSRPREPISEAVRHEVWRRDQGRCVDCGSKENLEFDHIVPWSEGGSNTARNLELRCASCNRKKGNKI
jgi:hypothetical protein